MVPHSGACTLYSQGLTQGHPLQKVYRRHTLDGLLGRVLGECQPHFIFAMLMSALDERHVMFECSLGDLVFSIYMGLAAR